MSTTPNSIFVFFLKCQHTERLHAPWLFLATFNPSIFFWSWGIGAPVSRAEFADCVI